ncbi:response regulator, partial [Patescibacteria group bacterium]|nr:response regulator [Patescibacteria group bacterium]
EGEEGIKKAREQNPDLILSDLVMPHRNGFETLEQIKKDKQLKNIPIIILSNLGQESDIKKIKELGAVDYLIKSDFKIKEVVEKINFHLAKLKK